MRKMFESVLKTNESLQQSFDALSKKVVQQNELPKEMRTNSDTTRHERERANFFEFQSQFPNNRPTGTKPKVLTQRITSNNNNVIHIDDDRQLPLNNAGANEFGHPTALDNNQLQFPLVLEAPQRTEPIIHPTVRAKLMSLGATTGILGAPGVAFLDWYKLLKSTLMLCDCWIDPDQDYQELSAADTIRSQTAKLAIDLIVTSSSRDEIARFNNSVDALKALIAMHDKSSPTQRIKTQAEICNLKYHVGEDINAYIATVRRLFDDMSRYGRPKSDGDQCDKLISGLPEEFSGFVATLLADTNEFNFDAVASRLRDAAASVNASKSAAIGAAYGLSQSYMQSRGRPTSRSVRQDFELQRSLSRGSPFSGLRRREKSSDRGGIQRKNSSSSDNGNNSSRGRSTSTTGNETRSSQDRDSRVRTPSRDGNRAANHVSMPEDSSAGSYYSHGGYSATMKPNSSTSAVALGLDQKAGSDDSKRFTSSKRFHRSVSARNRHLNTNSPRQQKRSRDISSSEDSYKNWRTRAPEKCIDTSTNHSRSNDDKHELIPKDLSCIEAPNDVTLKHTLVTLSTKSDAQNRCVTFFEPLKPKVLTKAQLKSKYVANAVTVEPDLSKFKIRKSLQSTCTHRLRLKNTMQTTMRKSSAKMVHVEQGINTT